MDFDPLEIAWVVGAEFDDLGVRYAIGGSLASSVHGLPRSTLDADLVADLSAGHGSSLAQRLGSEFYCDAQAMESAIRERRSFNLVHLASMFKVDVFVVKADEFAQLSFARSRPEVVGPADRSVLVTTPEDTVRHLRDVKQTTKDTKSTKMEFDDLSSRVIGCAIEVHRQLGLAETH